MLVCAEHGIYLLVNEAFRIRHAARTLGSGRARNNARIRFEAGIRFSFRIHARAQRTTRTVARKRVFALAHTRSNTDAEIRPRHARQRAAQPIPLRAIVTPPHDAQQRATRHVRFGCGKLDGPAGGERGARQRMIHADGNGRRADAQRNVVAKPARHAVRSFHGAFAKRALARKGKRQLLAVDDAHHRRQVHAEHQVRLALERLGEQRSVERPE
ncbi:hypothetical protein ET524_09575 [Senegalimassilia faecalis]|uniref:Uncharacterized protein n=1 Tax=Senegalimassilia faecalis TaxID=2509433 RepID=A0A4Q2K445_9ACTN|nr:hypothetical protein ET524_09575 [Senegalimassilia faecalis]